MLLILLSFRYCFNLTALETVYDFYKRRLNRATKTKIKNIIGLYDDRKIAQFTTADKLIRNFINAKTDQQKQKASDQYNTVYEKHKEKKPLGERMQTAKRDNKLTEIRRRLTQKTAVQRIQKRVRAEQSKETHAYSVDLMFFKFKLPKDTIKASFKDSKGRPLIPIWYETKRATIQTTDYVEDLSGRRVFQYETKDRYVFKKLMKTIIYHSSLLPHYQDQYRNNQLPHPYSLRWYYYPKWAKVLS